MADTTDPPNVSNPTRPIHVEAESKSNVVQLPTQPTHDIVYVCGERNGNCVCIESHETADVHVCYVCGDEWRTN